MNLAEATARLTAMTSPADDPVLTGPELTLLLDGALVVDLNGLAPPATGYTATWNLRAAAAEAWLWKAGKVADRYDFSSDVHSHSRDQLIKHCTEMAALYGAGVLGSMQLSTGILYDPVVANLNGGA